MDINPHDPIALEAALDAGLLTEHVSTISRWIDGEFVTTTTPDPGYYDLPGGGVKSAKAIRRAAAKARKA